MSIRRRIVLGFVGCILAAGSAHSQITKQVNVTSGSTPSQGGVNSTCDMTPDAKVVVFESSSSLTGISNMMEIVHRNLLSQITTTVSRRNGLTALGNGPSFNPSVSHNGGFIAFESIATNLTASDTNGVKDIFVRSLNSLATEMVSVSTAGVQGNADSIHAHISGDGLFVAFESQANNLVLGDTNGKPDIFVRDLTLNTTERVSVLTGGGEVNDGSRNPAISKDGRFVVFQSRATNLGAGVGTTHIYLHDRQTTTTTRLSRGMGGVADGDSSLAAISDDGRYVAFESHATNLVPGDTNGQKDVFLRDTVNNFTLRMSVTATGAQASGLSRNASISACIAFKASRVRSLAP